MCELCELIESAVERARREQDQKKLQVMEHILRKHQQAAHTAKHNVVAITEKEITWPSGAKWIVR